MVDLTGARFEISIDGKPRPALGCMVYGSQPGLIRAIFAAWPRNRHTLTAWKSDHASSMLAASVGTSLRATR
jgi:hypothetical protein